MYDLRQLQPFTIISFDISMNLNMNSFECCLPVKFITFAAGSFGRLRPSRWIFPRHFVLTSICVI